MENMIYVGELQPKNMFLYLYAFDPQDKLDLNIYCGSYLTSEFDLHMKDVYGVEKFDIVVMNPPYQELKEGFKKSNPLWNLFVKKVVETSLIENGYLVGVHPSGWRNIDGAFKNVQMLLKSRQMLYLEIHNADDGVKTFGAATRYDFYCVRNTENLGNFNTKIKCQDGTIERADISKLEFIPNGMFNFIQKLIAKKEEKTVEIIQSWTVYETRKKHMLNIQTEDFKYPCIDNVNLKNEISCVWYSNTNTKGHFGIPKVIFGQRCSGVLLDLMGEYGLTQHGYGIIDDIDKLSYIQKALLNPKFIELSKLCDFGGARNTYNYKILRLFRKDFWIDFLG
jgi:hypothetical protein